MSKRKPYEFAPAKKGAAVPWTSLETRDAEIAQSNELRERRAAEFAPGVTDALDPVSRRSFLTLMGASAALATMEGCRRPIEHIMPYARPTEGLMPGVPQFFATVIDRRGEAVGLVVESHEGRPTKIEGNPDHPSSLGATDLVTQASVLDLYDPDRSTAPCSYEGGHPVEKTWVEFELAFGEVLAAHRANGGEGLRILHAPSISPTFVRVRDLVAQRFPNARFHAWSAAGTSNVRDGSRLAFGTPVNTVYDYARARTIVAIDSDFLQTEPGAVRALKQFANGRRLPGQVDAMTRLYVVEPMLTNTGANADHRLRLAASQIEPYLAALAGRIAQQSGANADELNQYAAGANAPAGIDPKWLDEVARELVANRGASVVTVGARQPATTHALAHAINHALGNVGTTVTYAPVADPRQPEAAQGGDLAALAQAIGANQVQTLVILGGNPVYDAPGDLGFAAKLDSVAHTVHLSGTRDETSARCKWHVPQAHYLETWGDAQSLDGTVAVQQPLIAPLHAGRSDIELLGLVADVPARSGFMLVRETLGTGLAAIANNPGGNAQADLDHSWRSALYRGVAQNASNNSVANLMLHATDVAAQLHARPAATAPSTSAFEVVFQPDHKLVDGCHGNNAWLLEFPDPVTKVTWDNAAYISVTTAAALGLGNGDMVRVSKGDRHIELPVWILPGHSDNTLALPLGWGRTMAGRVGSPEGHGCGFDVNPLRTSTALWFDTGYTVAKIDGHYPFSQTQEHHRMEGRPIALDSTLEDYRANPAIAAEHSPTPRTLPLWRAVDYTHRNKWGMSIDLNACSGCGACAVACQAENNVPVVGKDQVNRGREMYWLRIDRYFVGSATDPEAVHQPLACVQCEEAPCENVCPVNATSHTPEGLNDMVYNRCIGTRYCSNNCPYKVRRFNYLNWHNDSVYQQTAPGHPASADVPETVQMQHNPNVTVRFRGVMEKCTYCVQRIQTAKIAAKREGRVEEIPYAGDVVHRVRLRDGEVRSACQQACPADAIVFGDLNNPSHRVAQLSRDPRGYKLLAELGTQPRTTFLARVRNPNPAMPGAHRAEAEG